MANKSEKRKERKEKKKKKLQLKLAEEKVKFNVIWLLKNNVLDTKPKVGDFLKQYVKDITVFNLKKIQLYPTFKYEFNKVFVKFLDSHEVIWIKDRIPEEFYLYDLVEEICLKDSDIQTIKMFFEILEKFSFVK